MCIRDRPDIVLISPSEFHYRIRTVLYFKNGILGHRRSWIFDLKMQPFPLDYCLLLHPKINEAFKLLKGFKFPENLHGLEIFTNPQSGETFLKLLVRGEIKEALIDLARKFPFAGVGIYTGEYLHWERKLTFGEWESSIKVNNYIFKISPDSFLQPNYLLWEKFQKLVKPLSESYKKAVELHAGIGFFTPAIAKRSREVESSDINPFAGKLREENLNRNGIKNVKNLVADAYKHIKRTKNFDLLLVDPPRGGLAKPVLKEILKKLPEEIIYVSCNLQSLKGDLETLKEKYKIVKTVLVDQFPNTYHIESIIWLKKT
jgi:23S rRNA (uracil1939-C5)-methyltransferase